MKEIIGDDYPTYEDSVNASLEERLRQKQSFIDDRQREQESAYTYLTEVEHRIHKDNLERLIKENFELRHRLSCIADDIEIIERHICRYDQNKIFKKPSLNADGSVYADQAWHNVSNIEIACDLSDGSSLEWSSEVMTDAELDNLNRDL